MSTEAAFLPLALSLERTTEVPHFKRMANKVARIYTRFAPDGITAKRGFPRAWE
jgi:hypothetical protein